MLEQACRSQPAQACLVQVVYMEGVGTVLGQNARVVCEMELKVQKLPYFVRGMRFCVLGGLGNGVCWKWFGAKCTSGL